MSKKHKRQTAAALGSLSNRTIEFNPDYHTTKHELKRTGVLWGILVGLLIVLGIFQNQILSLFLK